MGEFKAFEAKLDKEVNGFPNQLKEYYRKILSAAFPGLFLETKPGDLDPLYQVILPESFPDYGLVIPAFYIAGDNHKARSVLSVLERIADEENEYYYAWRREGDQKTYDKDKNDQVEILTNLKRVNALMYYNIIYIQGGVPQKTIYENHWTPQLTGQPTIPVGVAQFVATGELEEDQPHSYFGVYLNEQAPSFFIDTDEERSFYHFKKTADGYRRIRTEKPEANDKLGPEYSDFHKELRYCNGLLQFRRRFLVGKEQGADQTSIIDAKPSNDLWGIGNYEQLKNRILDNLTVLQTAKADEFADNFAKLLPPSPASSKKKKATTTGGFKCFYYKSAANELEGFLTSVNIGEGRKGSGGYGMRADKVSEVRYLWCWKSNFASDEQSNLAFLLSHIMGLEFQHRFNGFSPTGMGFFPTNWPCNLAPGAKTVVEIDNTSWFAFYKQFTGEDRNNRRNKPAAPEPPRIAGPQEKGYNYVFDTKSGADPQLNNRSYRVWRKGPSFAGESLGDGTGNHRSSAGSVMASALSVFSFYKPAGFPASTLSATGFMDYLIRNDDRINKQWKADQTGQAVNAVPALKTDQEWCHLLGHGDGGPEELGNFVSGSKHCNTEQLAIETGLRRITQNEEIPKAVREKLKAKITAYLFPSQGAWVTQQFSGAELKKLLNPKKIKPLQDVLNSWGEKFFESVPSLDEEGGQPMETADGFPQYDAGYYKLKTDDLLFSAFTDLSAAITRNEANRNDLFQFRQLMEKHFFQYLPVARWMRYKIYHGKNKIFDHVYDAQSQSFNYHEAQILDYTVERVIYQALHKYEKPFKLKITDGNNSPIEKMIAFWDYYKRTIKDRVSPLVPNDDQKVDLDFRKKLYERLKNAPDVLDLAFNDLLNEVREMLTELMPDPKKRKKTNAVYSVATLKVIQGFDAAMKVEELIEKIDEYLTPGIVVTVDDIKAIVRTRLQDGESWYKEVLAQIHLKELYDSFKID